MVNMYNPYAVGLKMTSDTIESMKKIYGIEKEEKEKTVPFEQGIHSLDSTRISREDVEKFAELSGDRNNLHIDSDYAKSHGPFDNTIAHGVLVMGSVSSALANFEGDIIIDKISDMDFTDPVYVGDRIEADCHLTEVDGRKGSVNFKVKNLTSDKVVLTGQAYILNAEGLDIS
jgi:3-hydroxybutyryl-CoA dehydratase